MGEEPDDWPDAEPRDLPVLTKQQQKAVTDLCRLHLWFSESGSVLGRLLGNAKAIRYFTILVLMIVLSVVMTVEWSVGYLFAVGLLIGLGIRDLQYLVRLARVWPLYESILDWNRVQLLSKVTDGNLGADGEL